MKTKLKFANLGEIKGTHGPVIRDAPDVQLIHAKYVGVFGTSEILGESGIRAIRCQSWIHGNFSSREALEAYLRFLDKAAGRHGTLLVEGPDGSKPRPFRNVTFLGFAMDDKGVLPDNAGTVDGGWWVDGTLLWHQLSVHED